MSYRLLQSRIILITMLKVLNSTNLQLDELQTAVLCAQPLGTWNGAGELCLTQCPTGDAS